MQQKDGSMPTIGGKTKVPDRFKDEFTGVLMSSPIQLPSSKKFMDRKTLLKSLKGILMIRSMVLRLRQAKSSNVQN